jgi:hypothetical protein
MGICEIENDIYQLIESIRELSGEVHDYRKEMIKIKGALIESSKKYKHLEILEVKI